MSMSKLIRIAVLGEIGSRNLGDDLGFILLRDEILKGISKRDRMAHVTYFTPVRFGDLDHSSFDAVVTGCGTLLDRQEGVYMRRLSIMQSRGTMTAILGSGWSDPFHVPNTKNGEQMAAQVLSNISVGSWIRGEGMPDLVWILGWRHSGAEERKFIGMNMGYAAYSRWNLTDVWGRVRDTYIALKNSNYPVTLVSCWPNDDVWYESEMPNEPVLKVGLSNASIASLSKIRVMVPFRGHLGVVAACAGSTVCPIMFSSKVEDMYKCSDVRILPLNYEDRWFYSISRAYTADLNNEEAIRRSKEKIESSIDTFCDALCERMRS